MSRTSTKSAQHVARRLRCCARCAIGGQHIHHVSTQAAGHRPAHNHCCPACCMQTYCCHAVLSWNLTATRLLHACVLCACCVYPACALSCQRTEPSPDTKHMQDSWPHPSPLLPTSTAATLLFVLSRRLCCCMGAACCLSLWHATVMAVQPPCHQLKCHLPTQPPLSTSTSRNHPLTLTVTLLDNVNVCKLGQAAIPVRQSIRAADRCCLVGAARHKSHCMWVQQQSGHTRGQQQAQEHRRQYIRHGAAAETVCAAAVVGVSPGESLPQSSSLAGAAQLMPWPSAALAACPDCLMGPPWAHLRLLQAAGAAGGLLKNSSRGLGVTELQREGWQSCEIDFGWSQENSRVDGAEPGRVVEVLSRLCGATNE